MRVERERERESRKVERITFKIRKMVKSKFRGQHDILLKIKLNIKLHR